MELIPEGGNQETKFNAGVDIALNLSLLIKQAEYYASTGNYPMWHIKLEAIERRMWSKLRDHKVAQPEIENIRKDAEINFRKYLIKYNKGKNIRTALADDIKKFLTDYEKSLIFWRDKFGYGMPLKDDSRFVL